LWLFGDLSESNEEVKILNDRLPTPKAVMLPLVSLDAETFQNYKEIPGTYTAEVRLIAHQRLTATLPLKLGWRIEGDWGETTLLRIIPHENALLGIRPEATLDGFVFTLRESGTRSLFRTSLTYASYVLRNRARKEALVGMTDIPKDIFGRFPAFHRLVVNPTTIYFTTAGVPGYQGPAINDEWLRQAQLLRIENRFVGQFSKSVQIEDFVMNSR
jgi:hypothetical protein